VRAGRGQRGQASLEWIGLVLLVSLLALGIAAAPGSAVPGAGLGRALLARLLCAADVDDACSAPELISAYGVELAETVRESAPEIRYEHGMTALPVDFRQCRGAACGNGPAAGPVDASDTGVGATAFVHVIDCRTGASSGRYRCGGARAGNLYLQFWLYYEDSTTARALLGEAGHHEDDWEGYEIRIGPGGTMARATSHHGYNYEGGPQSWPSDAGLTNPANWGPATGHLYVSGGSHAGHVHEPWDTLRSNPTVRARRRVFGRSRHRWRWTPADRLSLVPIETLSPADLRTSFEVDPPWRKPSYRDPEA
jgi:hypothetical protein